MGPNPMFKSMEIKRNVGIDQIVGQMNSHGINKDLQREPVMGMMKKALGLSRLILENHTTVQNAETYFTPLTIFWFMITIVKVCPPQRTQKLINHVRVHLLVKFNLTAQLKSTRLWIVLNSILPPQGNVAPKVVLLLLPGVTAQEAI